MSLLYDKVVNTIDKPPDQRLDSEIEQLLPWFRKKSDLFQSLHLDIVKDIVKNCQFQVCKRDTVIIRQMDEGDCFYIILSGTVAIHINTTLTEEEYESVKQLQLDEEAAVKKEEEKGRVLDRSKYGIYVGKIDAGKSFGELALINADCVRNATIIADETSDLLCVDRDLYNRSLRAFQANEFEERKEFVRCSPLFHNWQVRYKKMMAMSLKKKVLKFEDTIVRQGVPVDGIFFVIQGQCKVRLDPSHHENQYQQLYPLGNIAELERQKARELLRREMNLERSRTSDRSRSTYQRRAVPQSEAKKPTLKPLELCLARAVDTIGDLEMAMGLSTYSQTVECTEESIVYHLDQRNYDRLIEKRNPATLEMLRDIVHTKLTLHFSRLHEDTIPLYRFFLYTLDEKEKDARRASRMSRLKSQQQAEVNIDNLQKGPLVNMYGPGSVFFLIRKRAKEMKLRQQRRGRDRDFRFGTAASRQTEHVRFGGAKGLLPQAYSNNNFTYHQNGLEEEGEGHELPAGAMLNYYHPDAAMHGLEDADFYDGEDFPDGYYPGDGFDPADLDFEDGYDWASSDPALSQLEERLSEWHDSLGTVVKGSKVVRLHRYQFEDENRPKPGNKVYVRARVKPKNVSFFSVQNEGEDNDVAADDPLKTSAPNSRSPISGTSTDVPGVTTS
ncbi:uncharacterized protein LOC101855119 [Aplysia californica]|uniref:Uncharacterized protein LOC101855119 n=1 Tax=Aplysia californica TaxID=6500 RepID=A0ABM1VWP5_APLCA|nr:uncharacterized protein LOC101855119 [Aplysia californica]